MPFRVKNIFKSFLPAKTKPRYGHGKPPHQGLYNLINGKREEIKEWIVKAISFREELVKIKETPSSYVSIEPFWKNKTLHGLDLVMFYTVLASTNPSKLIEFGSGITTKVTGRVKKDYNLHTELWTIDPKPRAEIEKISAKLMRQSFDRTDLAVFAELNAGDIISFSNSHRIFPGSDVTIFFLEVLPLLAVGVKVHFQHIYLPYDYPQEKCDKYYSEQYGLAAFLLSNPERYSPVIPSYFISQDPELEHLLTPFWEHLNRPAEDREGNSFWIEITA